MKIGLPGLSRRTVIAMCWLMTVMVIASACGQAGPGEIQTVPPEDNDRVTVPDEISALPSDEVGRRLEGLFGEGGSGLNAPDVEPTKEPDNLPLDDILNALNSGGLSEIVISVSPSLSQGLSEPRLVIKTEPTKGRAEVLSTSKILFVPDEGATGSDSFEYELLDGPISVFSAVVELRAPGTTDGTP